MNNKDPKTQSILILLTSLIVTTIVLVIINFVWLLKDSKIPIPIPETTRTLTPSIKWEDYEANEYNLTFKYPEDWQGELIEKDAFNNPWRFKLYLTNKEEPIMRIFVEELNASFSLEEYWDNNINPRFKNGTKEYTLEAKNTTSIDLKIDGRKQTHPAYMLRYRYENNGEMIEVMRLITVYKQRGYNLLFNGNTDEYKQYQSLGEQVIQSFELTSP